MVTSGAADLSVYFHTFLGWLPSETFSQPSIQQFISLVMIATACILMGAGLPTTALYIMLVCSGSTGFGSARSSNTCNSHVLCFTTVVISEITPPVCASAYAAAGIAGANPFRTGLNAFTLGIGKTNGANGIRICTSTFYWFLPEYFTIVSFLQVSITCAIGIFIISTAVAGYFLIPIGAILRIYTAVSGFIFGNSEFWK